MNLIQIVVSGSRTRRTERRNRSVLKYVRISSTAQRSYRVAQQI